MDLGELFGYLASLLVFIAFYMRRMLPLRIIAIASNVAFFSYAWIDGLTPILLLHGALLPLNVLRLFELQGSLPRSQRPRTRNSQSSRCCRS